MVHEGCRGSCQTIKTTDEDGTENYSISTNPWWFHLQRYTFILSVNEDGRIYLQACGYFFFIDWCLLLSRDFISGGTNHNKSPEEFYPLFIQKRSQMDSCNTRIPLPPFCLASVVIIDMSVLYPRGTEAVNSILILFMSTLWWSCHWNKCDGLLLFIHSACLI